MTRRGEGNTTRSDGKRCSLLSDLPAGHYGSSRVRRCYALSARALRVRPERADVLGERLQILARDFEPEAVPRVHVGRAEDRCQALTVRRTKRNDRPDARRSASTPAAELVEVVQLGLVAVNTRSTAL